MFKFNPKQIKSSEEQSCRGEWNGRDWFRWVNAFIGNAAGPVFVVRDLLKKGVDGFSFRERIMSF